MIDALAVIRSHLLADSALVALIGTRLYAGVALPQNYTPADGPAVLFNTRGGQDEYHRGTTRPSVQYRCYGATQADCTVVDRALYDALQDSPGVGVRTSIRETYPQLLEEPDTRWLYMLSGYDHWLTVTS